MKASVTSTDRLKLRSRAGIGLGVDEGLDVGMVAAQRRHHGAAPGAGRHDGAAHGVPHVHEADRARGIGADALHQRALGAERGEVVADAAALLHGERGFLDVLEDGAEVVLDAAHHEAVEERDGAARAGAGQDAAGGQEGEVGHRLGEAPWPSARARAWARPRPPPSPPAPRCRRCVRSSGDAVRRLEAVFHVPDLLGDPGQDDVVVHLDARAGATGSCQISGYAHVERAQYKFSFCSSTCLAVR